MAKSNNLIQLLDVYQKNVFSNLYDLRYNMMLDDIMPHKTNLKRFDLLLPPAAVEIITKGAAIRCISPRTRGRVLIVEKIKDLIWLAPDNVLADVNPARASHATPPAEGA